MQRKLNVSVLLGIEHDISSQHSQPAIAAADGCIVKGKTIFTKTFVLKVSPRL
jgi:hypothetical protein